jgi:hypothetical protein
MIKRKPLELPPEIARRFFEDMRAFQREPNPIKRDEIAARQLYALRDYRPPRVTTPEGRSGHASPFPEKVMRRATPRTRVKSGSRPSRLTSISTPCRKMSLNISILFEK